MLCVILLFSFLLSGCLDNSSIEENADEVQGESASVEYRCISNPESKKKIYVILKNYHGDYWKTVIEGVEKAAKEVDVAIYLGGMDTVCAIAMGYCQRYFLKWRRCGKSAGRCIRFVGKE